MGATDVGVRSACGICGGNVRGLGPADYPITSAFTLDLQILAGWGTRCARLSNFTAPPAPPTPRLFTPAGSLSFAPRI